MSQLRGSEKFIWSLGDVLGQGATGAVYKGRHKRTGDLVAVKTFNQMSHMRPKDVQMREFEVMRKLSHENIVRLLAIEKETGSDNQVIVMELCAGGSLYNMLDNPENAYGIKEDEFFIVLNDVVSGMKHLKDNNMVHRDVKPGNIMRFIYEDGRSVYKLTDFGAARELNEEEEFMSLYGTEEYLFPDMYERAVLRRHTGKTFDASVDLWSLGVTLYHLATGQLPFRPYGGRKNKEMMYRITTEKESGVISGIQEELDGPVKWSKTLPATCCMSIGGRRLVQPMLAGLMECDQNAMWSFDRFFRFVKHICGLLVVHVFDLCHGQMLKAYVTRTDNLTKLQEELAAQTDIHPSHQNLLLNNCPLGQLITPMQTVETYPATSQTNPILFFYNEPANNPQLISFEVPTIPTFTSAVELDKDTSLAKTVTGIMFYLKAGVEKFITLQTILKQAADMYLYILKTFLENLYGQVEQFCSHVNETLTRLSRCIESQKREYHMLELLTAHTPHCDHLQELTQYSMTDLNHSYTQLTTRINQMKTNFLKIHKQVLEKHDLRPEWESSALCKKERCYSTVIKLTETVNQTWSDFKRDRSLKKLSFNEAQIHRFEKNRMKVNYNKGLSQSKDHCLNNSLKMFSYFSIWYRKAFGVHKQLLNTSHTLESLGDQYRQFMANLNERENCYQAAADSLIAKLNSKKQPTTVTEAPSGGQPSPEPMLKGICQQIMQNLQQQGDDFSDIRQRVENYHSLLENLGYSDRTNSRNNLKL